MESSFASRVREFRKSKGLSQEAFAERCRLEQGNITQMERGTEPKQSNVSKLVDGFPDLNPDWLLLGTGPMLRDGRTLTQLPAPLPPQVQEGLPPVPGTATPQQADFVGRLIQRLETELQQAQAREEYLQNLVTELLGKSPASPDAAAYVFAADPRTPAGFRIAAAAPVEAVVRPMWKQAA